MNSELIIHRKCVVTSFPSFVGLLNPLDCPHHMRIDDASMYREGIILDRPVKKGEGSFVNVGLRKDVKIDKRLKAGLRVTVKIDEKGSYIYNFIVSVCEQKSVCPPAT